jgi:ATP-binding cassette, subfamily G (WHITE), member 2
MQMGPSGSGKTTLLDVLAGRKTQGDIEGEILFSARRPSQSFLRRYTGYVEQFDTLLDILTVREMLLYTAEMKRDVSEPLSKKEQIVDHFVEKLGLSTCKDTRIGSVLNRCVHRVM